MFAPVNTSRLEEVNGMTVHSHHNIHNEVGLEQMIEIRKAFVELQRPNVIQYADPSHRHKPKFVSVDGVVTVGE